MTRQTAGMIVAALFLMIALTAHGQTTAPATNETADTPGPLRIHVTAVQGGSQYRLPGQTKWQSLSADVDMPEGVEFRCGPKGAIQFTIGTDQVYRVDRLTAAKILRARLMPDGTIKTDVGMTYGRVSKDVDAPEHPHQDTIVTPSSTLAVRGTRVSLYDQPPYEPEAVSLTGTAVYQNIKGQLIKLGAKGAGTAKVAGDSSSAAQYQLESSVVDPQGTFAGQTGAEQNTLLAALSGLSGTQLGVFQGIESNVAGQTFVAKFTAVEGTLPLDDQLFFPLVWNQGPGSTIVNYMVQGPNGEIASRSNMSTPSGGVYGNPATIFPANSSGVGYQEITWSTNLPGSYFPIGTYTITETLTGTTTQSLAQNPSIAVTSTTTATEEVYANNSKRTLSTAASTGVTTLNAANPTAVYQVTISTPSNGAISAPISLMQLRGNSARIISTPVNASSSRNTAP